MHWFTFWLILHILSVVAAFGPSYAFPLMVAMARKRPEHLGFAVEVTKAVARDFTMPGTIVALVTGVALIVTKRVDLFRSEWLLISLVLYAITVAYSMFFQTPNVDRMLDLLGAAPGQPTEGAEAGRQQTIELGKKVAMGGRILALLSLVIFVLMIWRPGGAFNS
jgi:uncharacterized membrane protein